MKRISFAGCLLFSLAGASLAEAADLQISKAPPFLPPPPFSWTGFYLGGNIGEDSAQPKLQAMSVLPLQPSLGLRSLRRFRSRQRRLMASSVASKPATIGKLAS